MPYSSYQTKMFSNVVCFILNDKYKLYRTLRKNSQRFFFFFILQSIAKTLYQTCLFLKVSSLTNHNWRFFSFCFPKCMKMCFKRFLIRKSVRNARNITDYSHLNYPAVSQNVILFTTPKICYLHVIRTKLAYIQV